MRIEKTILNCMESLHDIYFINEMIDMQSQDVKIKQDKIFDEYMLFRKMLVFYTNVPYRIKSYGDRLDIMYFDKDIIIKELKLK